MLKPAELGERERVLAASGRPVLFAGLVAICCGGLAVRVAPRTLISSGAAGRVTDELETLSVIPGCSELGCSIEPARDKRLGGDNEGAAEVDVVEVGSFSPASSSMGFSVGVL